MATKKQQQTIGWREWVSLPDLDIPSIKAKVDTGARTSSLHAFDLEIVERRGVSRVRFKVHPKQRDSRKTVSCEARLLERRYVRNSGGTRTLRPVISTALVILGVRLPIELTLVSRDEMGFRMLIGREAVRGSFLVDPGRSYFGGKPKRRKKKS